MFLKLGNHKSLIINLKSKTVLLQKKFSHNQEDNTYYAQDLFHLTYS